MTWVLHPSRFLRRVGRGSARKVGHPPSSSTPFTVGAGGTAKDGTLYPAEENIFYDEHYTEASQSLLDYSGLTSCQTTCTQYYYCYGMNIATFTVTRTYSKGTIQGTPVTIVTISKH